MSEDTGAVVSSSCCASCGIEEIDDINLKECDDCDLARYCSDECQENHKLEHEEACKKRAAELRDEILFKQPESSCYGDCPICCLPLPIDPLKSYLMECCGKVICYGCYHVNGKREIEGRLQQKCAFCREPLPCTQEQVNERLMKLIGANDTVAMCRMGMIRCSEGDYNAALEYLTKAVALGDVHAHYQLSCLYGEGRGVEKDEKREQHHAEQAAIGGHPSARYNLGCFEDKSGKIERAAKHFIIAANLGNDISMQVLKGYYKYGLVGKEVLAASLRAYNAAVDATKSPQREEAEKEKRTAELRDELLFKQPESTHLGDCPICCLPLSIDGENSFRMLCCLKYFCDGCYHANMKREILRRLEHKCPFCRMEFPKTEVDMYERLMKRVEAKDPLAMCLMGIESYEKGDFESAFEYWTKAAALGDVHAHYELSHLYHDGKGVEKDEKKKFYHLEEAASRGHPNARQTLGLMEAEKGRMDRAVKHHIIGAKLGNDDSLKCVTSLYKAGFVHKDDFASALRGHQAAIDATKSHQREEARAFFAKRRERQVA
jgi:TPR repeat protein